MSFSTKLKALFDKNQQKEKDTLQEQQANLDNKIEASLQGATPMERAYKQSEIEAGKGIITPGGEAKK